MADVDLGRGGSHGGLILRRLLLGSGSGRRVAYSREANGMKIRGSRTRYVRTLAPVNLTEHGRGMARRIWLQICGHMNMAAYMPANTINVS